MKIVFGGLVRGLEVVGISDDGTHVLLAASADANKPSHAVPIDNRLRAAVSGALRPDGEMQIESALSPKEIQSSLRAGATVDAVAKAAGVPTARIMRYAGPVLSERERIIDEARAATPLRDRGPDAVGPLGETAVKRLQDIAGFKPESVEWLARRRDDGGWIVTLSYSARGGAKELEWLWQPADRELRALSLAAARLTAPEAPAKRKQAAKRAAPAAPARAARKGGRGRPAKSVKVAPRAPKAAPPQPEVEPLFAPVAKPEPAPPRKPGERAAVPSWSDVLFGVQQASADADVAAAPANGAPAKKSTAKKSTAKRTQARRTPTKRVATAKRTSSRTRRA